MKKNKSVLVINGPNLNLLGSRENAIYGNETLASIETNLKKLGSRLGVDVEFYQSNIEGELVDSIQQAKGRFEGLIINPAAYTHTSIAIRDALAAVKIPTIEIHLSNIYQREEFRHHSYVAPVVVGQISGFGPLGYQLALEGLVKILA